MAVKTNKKEFTLGLGMMVAFIVVLVAMFFPIYHGHNGLEYLDALYNSISKGSAYYIPKVQEEIAPFQGDEVDLRFDVPDAARAEEVARQFNATGAMVNVTGAEVHISGDLGGIMAAILEDSESMYRNDSKALEAKYGIEGRQALYNWWKAIAGMDKDLTRQKRFKEAKILDSVKAKALETAYNYYGIEAQRISDRWGIVIFSLVFYVVYTLWYGFGIMFMFEGSGMKLEH
ncbi:MAG: hypothetical protein PHF66_13225 [Desulfobacteraceae bacterium]|jgi:hypothetical protein|nr:hypothetical protein [Desulfobacteraceae bacterium]